jgi:hypothetical protein
LRNVLILLVVAAVAAGGGYLVGRSIAPKQSGPYADGYRAGREDAFAGFDGGWAFDEPYIVILRRGGRGITYRIARRWPLQAGREYRSCPSELVCSRPAR